MKVAAIILAGGRGERLGTVNKALLEVGGRRLIDRALEAVADCEPIVVAAGANKLPPAVRTVPDLPADYAGPLAGFAAGIDALAGWPGEFVLTLAVDTPFFPAGFLARALPLMEGADVAIGAYAGQAYPTNALWRRAAVHALPDALRAGTAPRSLKRLGESLRAVRLDYAGLAAGDPFANANTPADLALLRARAGG